MDSSQLLNCTSGLLPVLAKLQNNQRHQYRHILQKEVDFLTKKIALLAKINGKQSVSLGQKIDDIDLRKEDIICSTEKYKESMQKTLKSTEKECNKKLDKMQRQRLQRQIQLNSKIDDLIMSIVDSNNISEESSDMIDLENKLLKLKIKVKQIFQSQKFVVSKLKSQFNTYIEEARKNMRIQIDQYQKQCKETFHQILKTSKNIDQALIQFVQKRKTQNLLISNKVDKLMKIYKQKSSCLMQESQ